MTDIIIMIIIIHSALYITLSHITNLIWTFCNKRV